MTLENWQIVVDEWIKKYGIRYFDEKTNALLLTEEVGELCRLIARKYGEQSFKKGTNSKEVEKKIGDEIADVFFVLTCLSNQMGYSLEEILKQNMLKKTNRDKERHTQNDKLK